MKKFSKFFIPVMLVGVLLSITIVSFAQPEEVLRRYDPSEEGIRSGYLCVDPQAGCITGIAPGTTLKQLNKLLLPGDLTADTEQIVTGTVLTSAAANRSLVAVVSGDVNSDGKVSITDMLMVKTHILGVELTGMPLRAGDVNADGKLSMSDYLMIKTRLLGAEVPFAVEQAEISAMILAPNAAQPWGVAGVTYVSDNEALVQISPEGILTAGSTEGTTFVYAMDEAGNITARQTVTVLDGGLQVAFDQPAYTVSMNQSLTLQPVLNHPVDSIYTWQTGDSAICSVSPDGVLTGHTYGETTLRVCIPNGAYAEVPVKVMPPITDMEFDRKLYKVKPGATRPLTLLLAPEDNGEQIIWSSSDPEIATVDDSGNVTGVKKGTVTITATGKYSGLTATCSVKVCNVIQVAITFDDGPSSHTPKLLDFLEENDIKATFFIVGNRINSYKNTVKRIVNEGHELAYHSYSHKNHKKLTTDKIQSDFQKSNELVEQLTGATFTLWRAPGGNINERVLDAIDLPHIKWTVDTLDWKYRNADTVYKAIISKSDDGEIILLHDLHKTSVEGAIRAMRVMQAGDYEFLTVTELLSRNGNPPKNNTNYNKAPK